MRIIYFGNNRVGLTVLRWLTAQHEDTVGLVVHPAGTGSTKRERLRDELIAAAALPREQVFEAGDLREPTSIAALRALQPDIGLSVFFGYILRPEVLSLFPQGCLNLHPAYLPYNRGEYPNVWSIVERTPAGATLHYMDKGVDTGDIVSRREVAVLPTDSGQTLYSRLEDACIALFKETWPHVKAGTATRTPQPGEGGTSHRAADVDRIDRIELDRSYTARELIDVIRARTFPPYRGAYFVDGGQRVYLRLTLLTEQDSLS